MAAVELKQSRVDAFCTVQKSLENLLKHGVKLGRMDRALDATTGDHEDYMPALSDEEEDSEDERENAKNGKEKKKKQQKKPEKKGEGKEEKKQPAAPSLDNQAGRRLLREVSEVGKPVALNYATKFVREVEPPTQKDAQKAIPDYEIRSARLWGREREPLTREVKRELARVEAAWAKGADNNWFIKIDGKNPPMDPRDLVKMCTPSMFGDIKNNTNRLDETVRKALEKKDGITLTPWGREQLAEMLPFISKQMYNGKRVKATINKLNVYQEGGFFKQHQDTPKPGVIGSLVVTLPYKYAGGALFLWHPTAKEDEEPDVLLTQPSTWQVSDARYPEYKEFQEKNEKELRAHSDAGHIDPSYYSEPDETITNAVREGYTRFPVGCTIQAVAFYGYCRHEVKPVAAGVRVTLSMNLEYADEGGYYTAAVLGRQLELDDDDYSGDGKMEKRVLRHGLGKVTEEEVAKFSGAPAKKTDRIFNYLDQLKVKYIGLVLNHRYSVTEMIGSELKGNDDRLYNLVKEDPRFVLEFLPIVIHDSYYGQYMENRETDRTPKGHRPKVYRFTEEDIEYLSGMGDVPAGGFTTDGKTIFVGGDYEVLTQKESEFISHTGNESQSSSRDNMYYSVALMVRLKTEEDQAESKEEEKKEQQKKKTKRRNNSSEPKKKKKKPAKKVKQT